MAKLVLSAWEEEVAKEIVDAAYVVHKALGPGLLESVYEVCFSMSYKNANARLNGKS